MTHRDAQLNTMVFILLLSSMLFGAYSLFYIKSYPVTVFTFILLFVMVVTYGQAIFGYRKLSNFPAILFIVYLIINCLFYSLSNINSMMMFELFFCGGLFLHRKISISQWKKFIKIFQQIMVILAIYGIYQLVGRTYGLPLTDLIWEGHMVEGFNWTNPISIGGIALYRSNAIFLEPSFFSQFLAIAICVELFVIFERQERHKEIAFVNLLRLFIFCISLVCTFSGTGILTLVLTVVIGLIVFSRRGIISAKTIWKFILLLCIIFLCALMFMPNIIEYLLYRATEILKYNENASSGYVRFVAGYKTLLYSFKENALLGIGIGNIDEFINSYPQDVLDRGNGFLRIGIELGIAGLILWVYYLIRNFRHKNNKTTYTVMVILVVVLQLMSDSFSMNYFWAFLYFLDVEIVSDKQEDRAYNFEIAPDYKALSHSAKDICF